MSELKREDGRVASSKRRDLTAELPLAGEASLVVIYGDDLGHRFPLTRNITIGRETDNDLSFETRDLSRHHAELRFSEERWLLVDLESTNGTEVNGERIREHFLSNGDIINLGGIILKYLTGGNVESLFHEEIYRLTVIDGLTGLHNKRYLFDFLDRELVRARRHGRPLSLAMIDIDHFKQVNDRFGHLAGDRLLADFGQLLATSVRQDELVARYGGEEFSLVLPEADLHYARAACERLRHAVEAGHFQFGEHDQRVTISIGMAQFDAEMTRDQLIGAADAQLYAAKEAGRNRVYPLA
jgi:diguanylate cyclase (GGDEF)-like protein